MHIMMRTHHTLLHHSINQTHIVRSIMRNRLYISHTPSRHTPQSAPVSPLSALYASPLGHVAAAQSNGLLSVANEHQQLSGPTSPNSSVTGQSLTLSLNETASPLPRNGHTRLVSIRVQGVPDARTKDATLYIMRTFENLLSYSKYHLWLFIWHGFRYLRVYSILSALFAIFVIFRVCVCVCACGFCVTLFVYLFSINNPFRIIFNFSCCIHRPTHKTTTIYTSISQPLNT